MCNPKYLKLDELKHLPDLAHAHNCDRILERYASILLAGKNFPGR